MQHILLPSTIECQATDKPEVANVVITPCHQGYGTTLGNSLRRVLLSSIPGAAVEAIKIEGVQHEFSAIPGVQEDMIELILNIKKIAVKSFSDEPVRLSLRKKGKGAVTAADFEKNADIEIYNPNLQIATITDDKKEFVMEAIIGKGLGYVAASQKDSKNLDLGTVMVDSFYSPVKDVGYSIENTRVGDITDYEKLTLTIETNGTITPQEALQESTRILIDHFNTVLNTFEEPATTESEESV